MLYRILVISFVAIVLVCSCTSKKAITKRKKTQRTERVRVNSNTTNTVSEPTINVVVEPLPTKTETYEETVSNYIDVYSTIAKEEMLQYGIPASITLAQGILESGAGRGELTQKANNHFGIKCHKEWTGERVYHDDDERQECFRKYKDPKYSFRDHSLFLTQRSRYQNLFKLKKDDYKGWAKGLKAAGYATDPKYPNKLIAIIERYNLKQYDEEVLGNSNDTRVSNDSKIGTYTVQKGDTLYSIARRHNITVRTLKEFNGLSSDSISVGQLLYLHSVKN